MLRFSLLITFIGWFPLNRAAAICFCYTIKTHDTTRSFSSIVLNVINDTTVCFDFTYKLCHSYMLLVSDYLFFSFCAVLFQPEDWYRARKQRNLFYEKIFAQSCYSEQKHLNMNTKIYGKVRYVSPFVFVIQQKNPSENGGIFIVYRIDNLV